MKSLCNLSSGVQVVDVTVNKPFKDEIRRLFDDHLDKHLELYVKGNMSASHRRISMTKWVGQAWKKNIAMKESIIRSFEKPGLPVALDGSENSKL